MTHDTRTISRTVRIRQLTAGLLPVASVMVSANALAWVGDDPVPVSEALSTCQYSSAAARLTPTGSVIYSVTGICYNAPISGQLSYDPHTQQFHERFFYRNSSEVLTMGRCDRDPWATGAPCTDQKVSIKGNDVGEQFGYQAPLAPFALRAANGLEVLQNAAANATRPIPPAPPVNVVAETGVPALSVRLQWLAPDESGNRPFVNFVVETRPAGAAGAAWRPLGTVGRSTTGAYQASWRLPPPVPGYSAWVVHACSTTVFAKSCSPDITPTVRVNTQVLTRQGGINTGSTVPSSPTGTGIAPRSALRTRLAPVAKVADAVKARQDASTSPPPVPQRVTFSAQGAQVDAHWEMPPPSWAALPSNTAFRVYERSTPADPAAVIAELTQPDGGMHSARFTRQSTTVSLLELCAINGAGQSCAPYVSVDSGPSP